MNNVPGFGSTGGPKNVTDSPVSALWGSESVIGASKTLYSSFEIEFHVSIRGPYILELCYRKNIFWVIYYTIYIYIYIYNRRNLSDIKET